MAGLFSRMFEEPVQGGSARSSETEAQTATPADQSDESGSRSDRGEAGRDAGEARAEERAERGGGEHEGGRSGDAHSSQESDHALDVGMGGEVKLGVAFELTYEDSEGESHTYGQSTALSTGGELGTGVSGDSLFGSDGDGLI